MNFGYAIVIKKSNTYEEEGDTIELPKVRIFKTEAERDNGIDLEWQRIWKSNGKLHAYDIVKFETKNYI